MQPVATDWNSINSRAFSQGENRRPGSLSVVTAPQRGRWHFPTAASKNPGAAGESRGSGACSSPGTARHGGKPCRGHPMPDDGTQGSGETGGCSRGAFPPSPRPTLRPGCPTESRAQPQGLQEGPCPPAQRNRRVNTAEKQTADRRTDRRMYNSKPEQGGQSRGRRNGRREAAGSETP